jgi:SAM-dependent methyltransferase
VSDGADWSALKDAAAAHHNVSPAVHPGDLLWDFIRDHAALPQPADVANYYFADGAESGRKLARIVADHVPAAASGRRFTLLEFASGYGMVTRHLPNALPTAAITSCDIHPEAVAFIRDQLGGTAVGSQHRPEDLSFDEQFDAVFALSFFTHMPEATFGPWLAALYRAVKPGGVLAFTTHGFASRAALGDPEIGENGFWFRADSEQHDLDGAEYGSSLSTPEFVIRTLFEHVRAPLAEFRAAHWWAHQDLYVVAKPPRDVAPMPGPLRRSSGRRRSRG